MPKIGPEKKIIMVSQCANKLAQDHRLSSSNEEMVIVPVRIG